MYEPFKELYDLVCRRLSIPNNLSSELFFWILVFLILCSIIWHLYKFLKWLYRLRIVYLINKDLSPYYSKADVERATKYYIETKYQNVSPSEDDEPAQRYVASAKNKLISMFINEVFKFKKNHNKHFLILADSGMGKTTFLINLYIRFKNDFNPFKINLYKIEMIPVWHFDADEDIRKIENKENTILLLDAFDEDIEAVKNYQKRLSEILDLTKRFRAIIITCRTQFFPSQQEEPYETGYFSAGENGEFKIQKLYLSVFDENDVSKYLRKQFSWFFQNSKLKQAKEIVAKCPNLVVRPMLLSHVKEFVDSKREFKYTFQIYDELINKWIYRESSKHGIKEMYGSVEIFQELLYSFSVKFAIDLYINRKIRNGYYLPKKEDFAVGLLRLTHNDAEFLLSDSEGKRKSLLNRNGNGEYKFSHKSILEYFLAEYFFKDSDFYLEFDFTGMDLAYLFLKEMIVFQLNQGQITNIYTEENNISRKINEKDYNILQMKNKLVELQNFSIKDFNKVIAIRTEMLPFDFLLFREFPNLKFLEFSNFKYSNELSLIVGNLGLELYNYLLSNVRTDISYFKKFLTQDNSMGSIKNLIKNLTGNYSFLDTSITLRYLEENQLNYLYSFLTSEESVNHIIKSKSNDIIFELDNLNRTSFQEVESFFMKRERFKQVLPDCRINMFS